jgi:nucleoside 2-deoxyribosyltransferase
MSVLKAEAEAVTEHGSIHAQCPKCEPQIAAALVARLFQAQEPARSITPANQIMNGATEGTDHMLQVVKHVQGTPLSVYLAGKMDEGSLAWRYTLLPPRTYEYVNPEKLSELKITNIGPRPCPLWSYAGPLYNAFHGCIETETQNTIFRRNLESIRNCDLLFANIASLDCYGTLIEIGIAHALGKPVYIAFSYELIFQLREFWIAAKCATATNTYKTENDLVRVFIEFLQQETPHRQQRQWMTAARGQSS